MATSPDATLQIGYSYMVPSYPTCSVSAWHAGIPTVREPDCHTKWQQYWHLRLYIHRSSGPRRTHLRTCSTSLRPIPKSDYPMAPVQRRLRASRAVAMNMATVVGAWPWIVGGLALVFVLFAVLCCIVRRRRRSATYFVAVSNANAMGSESGGPRNSSYMRPTRNRVPAMASAPGSTNCISNDPMYQGHSDGPLPKDDAIPSTPPPAYHNP
ncbi:hypothetical protein BKA82DRAFT_2437725 [Pisolithus tinctorius]|nr:hypothetical protein BKA82DRAFT_2437725 [Pisolithus tinctorius]